MLGAALASSFSLAMVNILRVLEIRVFLKINPYTLGYLKPLFCGLIAALPLVFLRGSSPLMASLLFIALYGALAFTLDIQGQRALNNFKKIVKDRRDRDET
jgi:beta-lactamase regulating signal transducer with metallopeptidase domain